MALAFLAVSRANAVRVTTNTDTTTGAARRDSSARAGRGQIISTMLATSISSITACWFDQFH